MGNLNEQYVAHLIEAMKNNSLVIFVGAGVSRNSGYPDWSELIEEFKKELELEDENDYLKIAQYYYDTWGKQKYIQKILDVFGSGSASQPNAIHDQIFMIQPRHLITTNYETLLEDKMNSLMSKYEVVKKDDDIPFAKSNHYIVKMHGDLSERNIVLKENDYLDYEKKFPMTSSLVKSLIMSNTVLFVGYSLGDSNFNNLFRMIQNSFNGSAKKAFLYSANRPKEPIITYYKERGINVISSLAEGSNPDEVDFGSETVEFLRRISSEKNPKVNNSEALWENLKFLNHLEFVKLSDVQKYSGIGNELRNFRFDSLVWESQMGLIPKKEDIPFRVSDNKDIIKFIEEKTWIRKFLDFESTMSHDDFIQNQIQQPAFDLYNERQYELARKKFRKIANQSFLRKDYWNYFIAEFNVRNCKSLWTTDNIEDPIHAYDKFEEILDDIIQGADNNLKRLAIYFRDNINNVNFLNKKLITIDDLLDKIRKERQNTISGGFSENNHLPKIQFEVRSLVNFIELNCLCVSHYEVYKLIINRYFEALLISLDNRRHDLKSESFFGREPSSVIEHLDLDDVKIIIKSLDKKMIDVYLENYGLSTIQVTHQCFEYLTSTIERLSQAINTDIEKRQSFMPGDDSYLFNAIFFLSFTEIQNINKIVDILENLPLIWSRPDNLRRLLGILYKNKDLIPCNIYKSLNEILNRIVSEIYEKKLSDHDGSFHIISAILKNLTNKGVTFTFSLNQRIKDEFLAISFDSQRMKESTECILFVGLVSNFYPYLEESIKEILMTIFKEYESDVQVDAGTVAFMTRLIKSDVYQFRSLSNEIFTFISDAFKAKGETDVVVFPNENDMAIRQMLGLLEVGYFDRENAKAFLSEVGIQGEYPEVDWIIFECRNGSTVEKLVKRFKFHRAKKIFANNEQDEKIFDEWAIRKVSDVDSKFELKEKK